MKFYVRKNSLNIIYVNKNTKELETSSYNLFFPLKYIFKILYIANILLYM